MRETARKAPTEGNGEELRTMVSWMDHNLGQWALNSGWLEVEANSLRRQRDGYATQTQHD